MNINLIRQIKQVHQHRAEEIVDLRGRLVQEFMDGTIIRSPEEWSALLAQAEWTVEALEQVVEGLNQTRKLELIVQQGVDAERELKLAGAEYTLALEEFTRTQREWERVREAWSSKRGHLHDLIQSGHRAAAQIRNEQGLTREVTRLQVAT